METAEQIAMPPLSAAKQDRIRIWRDEVVAASATCHRPDLDASSSSSSTTTSTSSKLSLSLSSLSADSPSSRSAASSSRAATALVLARSRLALARLGSTLALRKFRPRARSGPDDGPGQHVRTAMYAALARPLPPDYDDDENEDEYDVGAARGAEPRLALLRDRQERLVRAARLLDKRRGDE